MAAAWIQDLRRQYLGVLVGKPQWLVIAWVFRCEDIFHTASQHITASYAINPDDLQVIPQVVLGINPVTDQSYPFSS